MLAGFCRKVFEWQVEQMSRYAECSSGDMQKQLILEQLKRKANA